jgi:LuxR family transcriptional regulator, maltose regulon positive regulatory protein
MTDTPPLITTKLNIPSSHHGLVPRPQLFERLDRGLSSKLILICAPAGYGKSTLASNWLSSRHECSAWISLSENDNNWIQFFHYLITAFEKSNAGIGTSSLNLLNSQKPLAIDELMANLINDLADAKKDCIIALDDFHLINSHYIITALKFLIDNLPPRIKLVILTRTEPDLPVAKFRSQRLLMELKAGDMQFSLAESETFIREVMHLHLTNEDISELAKRTEGWVVGLQLAALSIGDRSSPSMLIANLSGKNRHIADYLMDEVLARQNKEVQSFLLKTSMLERMCGALCNSVLEIENGQSILETVERLNLFIIPLDNSRGWYRYHHLFAELLLSRLVHQQPAKYIILNQRACDWHRQHDFQEEAVRYALKAKDYDRAAAIVEQIGHSIYWANRSDTLRKWLDALPEDIMKSSFQLQILRGYVQINIGNLQAAEQTIENLKVNFGQLFISPKNEKSILEGKLASAFTSIRYHRHLDWEGTHQLARKALRLLPQRYIYERCVAYFHGGGALVMSGNLNRAEQYLRSARELSDSVKNPFAKLITLTNQGTLYMVRGKLRKALDVFKQAHEFGKQCRANQESTYSNAVAGIGSLYYEWNQPEKARVYLNEAIGLMEQYDFFDRILVPHEEIIRLNCGQKDFDAAEKTLQKTRKIVTDNGPTPAVTRRIEALSAYIAFKKNALVKAVHWADEFAYLHGDKVSCELELEFLIYARIMISSGKAEKVIALLQKMLALARRQDRLRSVIQIMIVLSMAYFKINKTDKGLNDFILSLQLAEPEGYLRSFVDKGEAIKNQLRQISERKDLLKGRDGLTTYIHTLLACFSKQPSADATSRPQPNKDTTIFSLTPRECDVLSLLDQGLTYAEIAVHLEISENTLKFHIKNVYSKLQVNKRIKAVSMAKKLGYI